MSTTAASATSWLQEKNPSTEEVKSVIEKLEQRIEAWEGEDDQIQGSIEAVDVLWNHLSNQQKPLPEEPSKALDSSALIPDANPVELAEDVKQATFEALKDQIGKTLKM